MSTNYSQYLGTRKCCDLKVQGPQGPQGAQGPSAVGGMGPPGATGATGPQGATGRGCRGATGAQGAQGAQGESQWTLMNGIAGSTGGYTGIGITGQDVLIYGNLLVTGGIDPTYLALTPQASGPQGFTNPLWLDTNGNLRSENILITDDNVGYTTNPQIILNNTNATVGNTIGVPSIETYKDGRIVNVNDIVFSQQFNAIDYNGNKKTFGKIECSVTNNSATNNIDGALDFYSCVDGNNNIVFRMNGADNENNCFRPLDMAGGGVLNTIKTSNGNLTIATDTSSVAGAVLTLATKNNVPGSGAGLALTGNTLLSGSAGASSGQFLAVTIGGTVYKIALLNA